MGDHLTYRNLFAEFSNIKEKKERKKWAKKHFVNYRGMDNAVNIYSQIIDYAGQHLGHQSAPIRTVSQPFFFFFSLFFLFFCRIWTIASTTLWF